MSHSRLSCRQRWHADFYLAPAWQLGNARTDTLASAARHPAYRAWDAAGRPVGVDYFCTAHRALFDHAHERLTRVVRRLRTGWLTAYARVGRSWPDRNEPCLCGSGRKFKRCCAPLRDELASL